MANGVLGPQDDIGPMSTEMLRRNVNELGIRGSLQRPLGAEGLGSSQVLSQEGTEKP